MTEFKEQLPALSERVLSDRSLLRRFRLGQEDAATALYRRYAARLYGLARRQCSPGLARRVDADDIVQSVFCAFFQAVRKGYYDVPDGDDLWRLIQVIALNKVRAKRTFHQAAKRDIRRTAPASYLASRRPAGEYSRWFLHNAFQNALEELGEAERDMVELLIQGYDVTEIAAKVGRSKRTVERNLQAVRENLRRHLERELCH